MPSESVATRLRSDLSDLTKRLADLIKKLPIEFLDRSSSGVFVIAPDYYWGAATSEQLNHQLAIKRDYEEWFEVFQSVFTKATDDIKGRIEDADSRFRIWIELSSNWSISCDRTLNEKELYDDARQFNELLTILDSNGPSEVILIPDTNAIAGEPAPIKYKCIAGDGTFVFLLLPTVLAELDALKINHRNPDFREKVIKVINRIKGWRNQGNLRDGVTVDRTITVKAIANEPDMAQTLTWLDKENRDDRIIASVLEVQSAYPNARTVLVTGDINLSNKADVARIETAELLTD